MTRTFTQADQERFASLSGDFNPLHTDPVRARRLLFGGPTVHGVHLGLWLLDQVMEKGQSLRSVRMTFKSPVLAGTRVRAVSDPATGEKRVARLETEDGTAVKLSFRLASDVSPRVQATDGRHKKREPIDRAQADLRQLSGGFTLNHDQELAARMFPRLAAMRNSGQMGLLLACTRIVGMEAPGLHSIFSGLDLSFVDRPDSPQCWRVTESDARMSRVEIEVDSSTGQGRLSAFYRPSARRQDAISSIRDVAPDEFRGQRALIVGGSRGLGEVAAKVLAKGGAQVAFTYHQGRQDAEALFTELQAANLAAEFLPFDVVAPADEDVRALRDFGPTHLYYFASPRIVANKTATFREDLFQRFARFYRDGLVLTVNRLVESAAGELAVFNASTTYVTDPPKGFQEYADAKAAGEAALQNLANQRPLVSVYNCRLPRLATDQTVSLIPEELESPTDLLLREMRRFRDHRKSQGAFA